MRKAVLLPARRLKLGKCEVKEQRDCVRDVSHTLFAAVGNRNLRRIFPEKSQKEQGVL